MRNIYLYYLKKISPVLSTLERFEILRLENKILFRIFVKLWQSIKNKYYGQTYHSRTAEGSC